MLYSNRHYSAEIMLDGVLTLCAMCYGTLARSERFVGGADRLERINAEAAFARTVGDLVYKRNYGDVNNPREGGAMNSVLFVACAMFCCQA